MPNKVMHYYSELHSLQSGTLSLEFDLPQVSGDGEDIRK